PVAGRVLSLIARPGMRLTGLNPGSLHDSSTLLTLYDPQQLQVRVDVRLDDVARVQPGQKGKVEAAALPGRPPDGAVLLAASQTDIQKNPVPVKVAISAPPATLKPEMLSQVTFLAPAQSDQPKPGGPGPYRLLVPRALVEGVGGEGRV